MPLPPATITKREVTNQSHKDYRETNLLKIINLEILTLTSSEAATFPLSDIEGLGDEPSSDPSGTGEGGCGGDT